jgi:hypothetical protein
VLCSCSTTLNRPAYPEDQFKIPKGTVMTFPAPVEIGFGIKATTVTMEEDKYLLSPDYYLWAVTQELEQK